MVGDVPESGLPKGNGLPAIPGLCGSTGEDEELAVPDAPCPEGRGMPILPEDGEGEDGKGTEQPIQRDT